MIADINPFVELRQLMSPEPYYDAITSHTGHDTTVALKPRATATASDTLKGNRSNHSRHVDEGCDPYDPMYYSSFADELIQGRKSSPVSFPRLVRVY